MEKPVEVVVKSVSAITIRLKTILRLLPALVTISHGFLVTQIDTD